MPCLRLAVTLHHVAPTFPYVGGRTPCIMFHGNHIMMKKIFITAVVALVLISCERPRCSAPPVSGFTTIARVRTTPVKHQGGDSLCWVYAMLATIESEHLMQGDSVNLSTDYVARMFLRTQAERRYLTGGNGYMSLRGTMPVLIRLIMSYGVMPYNSYHSDYDIGVVCRKIDKAVQKSVSAKAGLERWLAKVDDMLDRDIAPIPYNIYMYGARYTPVEFARSVCRPDEYVALTSFTHHPFGTDVDLELTDNYSHDTFYNLPLDTLIHRMEASLLAGHPVCWEGCTRNDGFSFDLGVACLSDESITVTPQYRQKAFERFDVTDDHCMELVGIARDSLGRRYFICKNSWGTDNPYGGFMYMSYNYTRLNTVAVMMKRDFQTGTTLIYKPEKIFDN